MVLGRRERRGRRPSKYWELRVIEVAERFGLSVTLKSTDIGKFVLEVDEWSSPEGFVVNQALFEESVRKVTPVSIVIDFVYRRPPAPKPPDTRTADELAEEFDRAVAEALGR